eukprot:Sdes_comp16962_c1_seq1m6167
MIMSLRKNNSLPSLDDKSISLGKNSPTPWKKIKRYLSSIHLSSGNDSPRAASASEIDFEPRKRAKKCEERSFRDPVKERYITFEDLNKIPCKRFPNERIVVV